jgi:ribosomal protein S18 acetylase RimI-like enzyme
MIPALNNQAPVEKLLPGSPDLNVAADVLADAFMSGNPNPTNPSGPGLPDPFYDRYNLGDQKVRDLFRSIISLASEIGHTIAVVRDEKNQIVGTSWIKEHTVRDMNLLDFPKLTGAAIRAFGFIGSLWYSWDVMNHIPVYPTSTTYISMIGVTRPAQGKGIGKKFIQYAINSAASQNAADRNIVLSTMNPRNIEIYQRLGFVLVPEKETQGRDYSAYRTKFTTFHMVYKPRSISGDVNSSPSSSSLSAAAATPPSSGQE